MLSRAPAADPRRRPRGPRGPRACARGWGRDVRARDVHSPALRLEKRDHRPDLLGRELAGHDGHDRLIAGNDERGRVVERLEQVLLAGFPRLTLRAADPDLAGPLLVGQEVRGPGAESMARRAAADAVEHLVPGGHELFRRHVGAEGQSLRHLGLDLRDLVRDQRIDQERAEHDAQDPQVSAPHDLAPSAPLPRTSTSPPTRRARRRIQPAGGRSVRRY